MKQGLDYRNDVPLWCKSRAETKVFHNRKHTKIVWRFCEYTWRNDDKTIHSFRHVSEQVRCKNRNIVAMQRYDRQSRLYEREVFGHNNHIFKLM